MDEHCGKQALISVSSNMDPEANILRALDCLATQVRITGTSVYYVTEPIDRPEQDLYRNGVVRICAAFGPSELKYAVLRPIEAGLGRVRTNDTHAPRPIDLDILDYDGICLNEEGLVLPDPDLTARSFLAAAVLELEPGYIVPTTGQALADLSSEAQRAALAPDHKLSTAIKERFGP